MPRRDHDDEGFTLIELMVVVLIIAIVLAIAVPTFFGAQKRARDRRAQALVRNVLTAQLAHWADGEQFTDDPLLLPKEDNAVSYAPDVAAIGASPSTVFVMVSDEGGNPNDTIVIGARADVARCYWIRMVGNSGLPRFARDNCTAAALSFGDKWVG